MPDSLFYDRLRFSVLLRLGGAVKAWKEEDDSINELFLLINNDGVVEQPLGLYAKDM